MVVESRSLIRNAKNTKGLERDRVADRPPPPPFPKLCASYFRFAHFHTLPLYYLRAWHRLPLNYRRIVGANTNEVQETIILYTARIEVLIGGIVVKVMVVHLVCKAHKLISVGNSCKNFHLFIFPF